MGMSVGVPVFECVEARGGGPMSSSFALHVIPLRQRLSLNLELTIFLLDCWPARPSDPVSISSPPSALVL